jgi:hypothetical protein
VGYFESKPEAGSSSPLIEESDIQLATQYSSKAEDARTEQQDAAGLRSPLGRAGQRERFRRNRANGVLIGRGRSTVLIPVDRGVHRAAGGGAGVGQGHVALRERPYDDDASKACLVQGKTIRVSTQEGIGHAGQGLGSAAERRAPDCHVHSRQNICRRGIPVNEIKACDGGVAWQRERVADGEAKVNGPSVGGAIVGTVGIQGVGHGWSNSQHQAA